MMPIKLRNELDEKPFFHKCMLTGVSDEYTKIDWHHAFEYKTKTGWQINEPWAIAPIRYSLHSPYGEAKAVHRNNTTKEYVKYLLLKRADLEHIKKKYPKHNWDQTFKYLHNKYKNFKF